MSSEPGPTPPADDTADTPPAGADSLANTAGRPTWTYFLSPAALLIGAVIIAATVWFTRDDAEPRAAVTDPAAASTQAADTAAITNLPAAFASYARQLRLDESKFQQCIAQAAGGATIASHLQRGQALGVTGTPTFFINNKRLVGAQPAAVFKEIIDLELRGSPTSLDAYSATVRQLAAASPPRFEIMPARPDLTGAAIKGSASAKVVIAEFSDFQCPFCKRWTDDTLRTIPLGNEVALAFLHFPLTQIHPNADNASIAAICAGEQGEFWPMHDLLFARQSEWQSLPVN